MCRLLRLFYLTGPVVVVVVVVVDVAIVVVVVVVAVVVAVAVAVAVVLTHSWPKSSSWSLRDRLQ